MCTYQNLHVLENIRIRILWNYYLKRLEYEYEIRIYHVWSVDWLVVLLTKEDWIEKCSKSKLSARIHRESLQRYCLLGADEPIRSAKLQDMKRLKPIMMAWQKDIWQYERDILEVHCLVLFWSMVEEIRLRVVIRQKLIHGMWANHFTVLFKFFIFPSTFLYVLIED